MAQWCALRDRGERLFTTALGVFHRAQRCIDDGAASTAAWLAWRATMPHREASRLVSLSSAASALPAVDRAWAAGRLSTAQVEAFARTAADHLTELQAHEHELVPVVEPLSARHTKAALAHWAWRIEALHSLADRDTIDLPVEPSTLSFDQTFEGRWHSQGSFSTVDGATIEAALRVFDCEDLAVPVPQRRARALVAIARFALDHRDHAKSPRHRPHLSIHLTASIDDALGHLGVDSIGCTDDGSPLDPATTGALLCDATVQRVVWSPAGHLLDYGRATRTIPGHLRQAVLTRDRQCRYPGCDRPAAWTDIHHVKPWQHGGITAIGNLVALCVFHHHRIHQPGWSLTLGPTAEVSITTAVGKTFTTMPNYPPWTGLRC